MTMIHLRPFIVALALGTTAATASAAPGAGPVVQTTVKTTVQAPAQMRVQTAVASAVHIAAAKPAHRPGYAVGHKPVHPTVRKPVLVEHGSSQVPGGGQVLKMVNGRSRVLTFDRLVAQAMVGDPAVADVVPLAGDAVYVVAKRMGATNLTFYDVEHRLIAMIDVSVGPDAASLTQQIAVAMPGEHVVATALGESFLLGGEVSSSVAAARIVALAQTFSPVSIVDTMTMSSPQQVMLDVRFSEMRRSTVANLGIRAIAVSNKGNFTGVTGDAPALNSFGAITGSFGIGALNINLTLDALEQKGLVKTLAQPNLIAMSGESASFLAGGEFPVPVASAAATGTGVPTVTIAFKEFGVSLKFLPTVLAGGIINLVVAPEVSSIDPNASIVLNGISIPGLQTRKAKTTLEMHDGESFAIAGLLRSDFTDQARQMPLLGNIPILGALFRSTSFNRGETELVIIVTPHIVRPVSGVAIKLPTDAVLTPRGDDLFLKGFIEDKAVVPSVPAMPRSASAGMSVTAVSRSSAANDSRPYVVQTSLPGSRAAMTLVRPAPSVAAAARSPAETMLPAGTPVGAAAPVMTSEQFAARKPFVEAANHD